MKILYPKRARSVDRFELSGTVNSAHAHWSFCMAVLTNPTLDQLRHIKEQNLENLFAEVTVPGVPRLSRVFGVGIGPATTGNGRSVEIETTGTNTIVLLLDEARLEPGDVPPLLTGIDVDGSEISVVPALVPSGTWRVNPFDRTSNPAPVQPQHFDMDQELDQPDPESPSGRLVIGDRAERSQLIGGLHVGVSYDIVRARRPLCEAIKTTEGFGGTLGCIAETTDTHKFVALTCHHVVIQGGSVFTTTTDAQGNETGKETLGDYQLVKRDDRYVLQVRPLGTASYFDASTKRVWGMTNGMRSDDFVVGHPTPGNACELARDEIGRFYRSQLTEQVDAAAIVLEESQTECCLLPRFLDGDLTDWRQKHWARTARTTRRRPSPSPARFRLT